MRQHHWRFACVALAFFFLPGGLVQAQVSYSVIDSIYTQDFDSLPNTPQNASLGATPAGWIDDTTSPGDNQFSIPGWYLFHPITQAEGGANGNQRMRAGIGSANTGSFWSYGESGSTERALGSLGSATVAGAGSDMFIALRLVNSTGQTLDSFSVAYDGEQWRVGGASVIETLSFAYSLTATTADWNTTAAYTTVPELNFTSPVTTGAATGNAVDGNGLGRVADIAGTISGITWAPGAELWLRWSDPGGGATSQAGMAIDNFRFSTMPLGGGGPTEITSVMSGLASSGSTWSNSQPPTSGNLYRVLSGHTVTIDSMFAGDELRASSGGTIDVNASGNGAHIPLLIIESGANLTKSATGSFYLGDIFSPIRGRLQLNADIAFTIDAGAEFGLDMRLEGPGNIEFDAAAGSRLILTDAANHAGTIRFNGAGDQVRLTELSSGGFGTLEMNSIGANTVYYNPGVQADVGTLIFNQPGRIEHAATSTSPLRRLHGVNFLEANAPVTVDLTRGFPDDSNQTEERRWQVASGVRGSADITVNGTPVDYSTNFGISLNEFEVGATGEPSNVATSTYSGTIHFNDFVNAEIRQHFPDGRFVVNNNARLEMGHQTLSANHSVRMGEVVVNSGGILEVGFEQTSSTGVPGHHAYTLTLTSAGSREGSLTLNSGANLRMQVNGLANNEFDRILADGDVQLGGTLHVLVNPDASMGGTGTQPNPHWTPTIGDTFDIIQVVGGALQGDFNVDGAVDAADYVMWRKNAGTQDEYNQWRANFGAVGAGGDSEIIGTFDSVVVTDFNGAMTGFNFKVNYTSTTVQLEVIAAGAGSLNAAVPEPCSFALAALALAVLGATRRRSNR